MGVGVPLVSTAAHQVHSLASTLHTGDRWCAGTKHDNCIAAFQIARVSTVSTQTIVPYRAVVGTCHLCKTIRSKLVLTMEPSVTACCRASRSANTLGVICWRRTRSHSKGDSRLESGVDYCTYCNLPCCTVRHGKLLHFTEEGRYSIPYTSVKS